MSFKSIRLKIFFKIHQKRQQNAGAHLGSCQIFMVELFWEKLINGFWLLILSSKMFYPKCWALYMPLTLPENFRIWSFSGPLLTAFNFIVSMPHSFGQRTLTNYHYIRRSRYVLDVFWTPYAHPLCVPVSKGSRLYQIRDHLKVRTRTLSFKFCFFFQRQSKVIRETSMLLTPAVVVIIYS